MSDGAAATAYEQPEQVGAAEYRKRYVAPSGRGLAVNHGERVVLAEKV